MMKLTMKWISSMFALALALASAIASSALAAEPLGTLASWTMQGRSLVATTLNGQKLRVTPYGDRMARVQAAPAGATFTPDSRYEFVARHDWDGSFAVTDRGAYLALRAQSGDGPFEVRVSKNPLRVSFHRDGAPVLSEDPALGISTGSGVAAKPSVNFNMNDDDHFAGLGHGKFGRVSKIDLRDQVIIRGSDTQSSLIVPFFMSARGYGVFVNSSWKNQFSFKPSNYQVTLSGGQMDYFFVDGPSFAEIIDRYTSLIGKPRLLPMYALGLMMSDKDRGSTGSDVGSDWWKETVTRMRQGGWPLEVLVHDNTWRGGKIASWKWDPKHYPDPAAFERWSRDAGVVSMLDFNRGDSEKSDGWKHEYALPGTNSYPDFSSPVVRDWFWGLLYGKAFDPSLKYPADMIWLDEFDMNPNVTGPLASGRSWEEEQNNYYFLRDKCIGEGWNAGLQGTKRPFFMNRAMTAGSQRFGGSIWSGDIQSSFGEMKDQVRGMLQAGLSGVPYWGMDQGGFKSMPADDLYRQWSLAQGALSPIWKPHGLGSRYPWLFSPAAQGEMRAYGALRSKLIPYLYTYAARSAQTGAPMARAMVFDHQSDPRAWAADQQYQLGSELIVAPVMASGPANQVNVWLPAGTWYDYWTDAAIAGDRVVSRDTKIGAIPVFVRAGAIVPQQTAPQLTTAALDRSALALHVYPGADGAFSLYEDDGVTERYRQGESRLTWLTWNDASATLEVHASRGYFAQSSESRRYEITLHAARREPTRVWLNEVLLATGSDWAWDAARQSVTVRSPIMPVGADTRVRFE